MQFKNTDSINLGAGDDYMNFETQNIGALNVGTLDGGSGSDWLTFHHSNVNFANKQGYDELTLDEAGATNFENIQGTENAEVIKGDANANILTGSTGGNDTLHGYAGDDYLFGQSGESLSSISGMISHASSSGYSGNDTLNGGDGDDYLYGGYGTDTLDGGAGTDNLFGGAGNDVFVIRANDGSTSLSSADVIGDYIDNSDSFGMADGLGFSDLTISQGTSSYSSHTLIMITSSSEYLGIITNTTATDLTTDDFAAV
jgi:Ca2+-binding RTX toxin-like protein